MAYLRKKIRLAAIFFMFYGVPAISRSSKMQSIQGNEALLFILACFDHYIPQKSNHMDVTSRFECQDLFIMCLCTF